MESLASFSDVQRYLRLNPVPDVSGIEADIAALEGDFAALGTWQAWTPSYAGLTVGNGTVGARYVRIGNLVHCEWRIVWGSTSSATAAVITVSMPVDARTGTPGQFMHLGQGGAFDTSTAQYAHFLVQRNDNNHVVRLQLINATAAAQRYVGNANPFTFATNDQVWASWTYEAA